MATAEMKMVNGRVDSRVARKAGAVLGREGLTVSSFIRNSLEHIARTGEVPECGKPDTSPQFNRESFRELIKTLEAKPMPGKEAHADLDEDELVEKLMMERYGY